VVEVERLGGGGGVGGRPKVVVEGRPEWREKGRRER